jgi:hypothetical protein
MDMQTLLRHHGKLYLTVRREHFNKKNIVKKMVDEQGYIPRSARNKFKITCLKETTERAPEKITELQDIANQAINNYQNAIKGVIVESAKEDKKTLHSKFIKIFCQGAYDIAKANIAGHGHSCDATQKIINMIQHTNSDRLLSSLNASWVNIQNIYKEVHSIQGHLPAPSEIPEVDDDMEGDERALAIQLMYTASELPVNYKLEHLLTTLEACFYSPWQAFLKQNDENQRLLALRKISNEAIIGTTTDQTALMVDNEPPMDQPTLATTIAKEIEKATKPLLKELAETKRQLKKLTSPNQKAQKNQPRGRDHAGASDKNKIGGRNNKSGTQRENKNKKETRKQTSRGRSTSTSSRRSTSRRSRSSSRSNHSNQRSRKTRPRKKSAAEDSGNDSDGSNSKQHGRRRSSRRSQSRSRRNSRTRRTKS